MEFKIALSTVLLTLFYIVPGYALYKAKKAKAEHLSTLSSVLVYALSPCMIISSFINMDYTLESLKWMGIFFIFTLVMQSLFMAILYAILRKKFDDAKYRLMNIGMVLGNCGFFGLPMVKALLPNNPEAACYSSIYVVSMNILVFTMGIYCLTGKSEYMTLKSALLNPSVIAFYFALPLFLLNARTYLPDMVINTVNLLGSMTTPICMIILGIRLATIPFKKLFTRPEVYTIIAGKLIIFPLFCYMLVYLMPFPFSFKACILILAATPCASITLNLAEIHHSEADLSANCILLSTLLSFITLPIMTLLL